MREVQTEAPIKIEQWPVETNRQRVIRFFREHDGERTCYGKASDGRGGRCAVGLMSVSVLWGGQYNHYVMDRIVSHFDNLRGSFGDFARHLESCEKCWMQAADEPYAGD